MSKSLVDKVMDFLYYWDPEAYHRLNNDAARRKLAEWLS